MYAWLALTPKTFIQIHYDWFLRLDSVRHAASRHLFSGKNISPKKRKKNLKKKKIWPRFNLLLNENMFLYIVWVLQK